MKKPLFKPVAVQAVLMMSFWAPQWYTYPTPVYPTPIYHTPVYFTPVYSTPISPTPVPTPTPIIACPQIFQPVCGINGVTFGNRCEAEVLSRVPVAHEGPCGSFQPLPPPPRCHWWWPCVTWPPTGPVPTFGPIPTTPPIGFPWPTLKPWPPMPLPTPQNQNPFGTFCSPHIPVCIPTVQAG